MYSSTCWVTRTWDGSTQLIMTGSVSSIWRCRSSFPINPTRKKSRINLTITICMHSKTSPITYSNGKKFRYFQRHYNICNFIQMVQMIKWLKWFNYYHKYHLYLLKHSLTTTTPWIINIKYQIIWNIWTKWIKLQTGWSHWQ